MRRTRNILDKKLHILSLGLFLFAFVLGACAPQAVPTPTSTPAPTGTVQPSEIGGYTDFVEALQAAGTQVEPAGEAQPGFFDLNSQIIKLNGVDVQVMEFPDEAAREAAAATISPDGTQIGTSIIRWMDQPHFWGTGRLIVLYVGTDPSVIDTLTQVLGTPITS